MIVLLVIMCALLGLTLIISTYALTYASLLFFIGTRMTVAGLLLLGYTIFFGKPWRVASRDWLVLGSLSVTFIFLPFVAECFALQYLVAAKVALIWSLEPFCTALWSRVRLGERLSRLHAIGLTIGFLGIIPILLHHTGRELLLRSVSGFSIADAVLLACVAMTSYSWVTFKGLLRKGYSGVQINGYSMLLGGCWALISSGMIESWQPVPVQPLSMVPVVLACAACLIVIGNLVSYNLYGLLLERYSATFLSLACGTIPCFTAFFEWVFLGRPVSAAFVFSLCLVMIGSFIFYRASHTQHN